MLVSHATLFLEVINQKHRSSALSPHVIATLIPPTLSLECFDERTFLVDVDEEVGGGVG